MCRRFKSVPRHHLGACKELFCVSLLNRASRSMSSPITHLACAYVAYSAATANTTAAMGLSRRSALLAAAFFSLAPDLDYAAACVGGSVEAYHNHFTHSLVFVLGVAGLVAVLLRAMRPMLRIRFFFLFAAACGLLHLAVDYCTHGRGLMLLWPWSGHRFISPYPIFQGVRWSEGWISSSHGVTLAQDAVFAAILVLLTRWIARRRARVICHAKQGAPSSG